MFRSATHQVTDYRLQVTTGELSTVYCLLSTKVTGGST